MNSEQSIPINTNKSEDSKPFKGTENNVIQPLDPMKLDLAWRVLTVIIVSHIGGIYGAYLLLVAAKWQTYLFAYFLHIATMVSVTAGAHRLWTHKSYKAKLPLRILLLSVFTMAFQDSCIIWVRNHRMHHKYVDTDADPHNSRRGFFFSHMGWLMIRKHPQVRAHTVDLSDLKKDTLLCFQHKYYLYLVLIACFIVPTYVPTLWGEEAWNALFVCVFFRYVFTLHVTSLVNSVAHMTWGTKPYDKHIEPVETKIVSFLTAGEGFHNYHHTFPWDYRTAELGGYSLNITKLFIDFMAKIGWAYDLKIVPDEVIKSRVKRTGDGTHPVWGWDDPDFSAEDKKTLTINHLKRATESGDSQINLRQTLQPFLSQIYLYLRMYLVKSP